MIKKSKNTKTDYKSKRPIILKQTNELVMNLYNKIEHILWIL
jgi:hypothetical protein